MDRRRFLLTSVAGALAVPFAARAQQPAPGWSPAPKGLGAGVSYTIIAGNPQTGPFTVRVRHPPGHTSGPHWHRHARTVTVLSGTLLIGWGEVWDATNFKEVRPGESVVVPGFVVHFTAVREETVLESTMSGAYDIEYVLDADDPRR